MGTTAQLAGTPSNEQGQLAEEQAALRRVATLVARGASSAEVFAAVAEEAAQVLRLGNAAVCRFDAGDGGAVLTVLAVWGERPQTFEPGTRWPLDGPSVAAEVLRTGRAARVEDYTDVPGTLAAEARSRGFNRNAGAPIIVDGHVWGVVLTSLPDAPLPDHVEDRLADFTELVATAIANSDAQEELTRVAAEQAALGRVATLVAAGAAPAEVFATVAEEIARLVPADGSAVSRYEPDGMVTALGGWSADGGFNYAGVTYPLEGTVSGRVFQAGRPARVDSYADAPGLAPEAARDMGWRSSVGAPIAVGGRLWGVLAVASRSEEPLPTDTERRLIAFAGLVATAIANAESSAELRVHSEEQVALRRVATLVAHGLPASEIMAAVAAEAERLLGADWAGVYRFDADGVVTTLASHGALTRDIPVGAQAELDHEGVVPAVKRTGRSARMDSAEGMSGSAAARRRELGIRSAVAAPITVEDRLWGAMCAIWRQPGPVPIVDAEGVLARFTELVATAIANAESREEVTRLAEEQAALRRVATLVAERAEPNRVFAAVADEVAGMFGVPIATMLRFDADGFATLLATAGAGLDVVGARFPIEDSGLMRKVFETGDSAHIDDWRDVPGRGAELARQEGVQWSVAVPIVVDGALWGMIIAASRDPVPRGADVEQRLAKFTELVATAVANTQAHEQLAQLADEQAALRRVATLVAEGATPQRVFDAVRQEVARIFEAPLSVLMRYADDGTATVLATAEGYLGPIGRTWPVEGDSSAIARVSRTGRPARADYTGPVHGPIADAARTEGARSAVGVPIVVDGALWGVMAVGSRETGPLPADIEHRLEKFTQLLATAIANAEGRAELDASRARIVATADATRRRIERDLHDGAQQRLVSLALEARAAEATVPPGHRGLRGELAHIAEGITGVLDGLREIALGLHPALLAEGGIGPALKTLAHRSQIPVELHVRVDGRLPDPLEVAVYYVVSEALTNAAKHAQAVTVHVDVEAQDRVLRVSVCDDGVGGADPSRGSGLVGLKDRAEAIGGTISIDSPRGRGTSLRVELPLGGELQ